MEFRIERAFATDVAVIADVIQRVWEQVENKEWFVADNWEYVSGVLQSGKGMAYRAVDEASGETAGVFIAVFPGETEQNLGRDIGLTQGQLLLVAHMDSVAILPEYRGNRLQYKLMQKAEQDLRRLGYRYLMCTVHPDNRFSLDNIVGQGYEVMMTKEKYGGYLRDILMKEIREEVTDGESNIF